MYVNVEIYNVEQRQINVVYFSVDTNNIRQRRNNSVIFNVEFHNVDQKSKQCREYDKHSQHFFELQKKMTL